MSSLGVVYLFAILVTSGLKYVNIITVSAFELAVIFIAIYLVLLFIKALFLESNKQIPLEEFLHYPKDIQIQGRFGNDNMAVIRRRYLIRSSNPLIL